VSLLLPEMHEIRYGHEKRAGKELVKAYLKVFFSIYMPGLKRN
jgi:hypothetical protein